MERRENQLQTVGICRRVFTFVMNTIALRGIKRVTLGHPQLRNSTQEPLVVTSPHKDASHTEQNSIDSEPVMVQIPRDYDGTPKIGMNLSLIHIDSGLSSDAAKSSKPVQVRSRSPRTVPIEGNGLNNRKDYYVREKDNNSSALPSVVAQPLKPSKKNDAVKMQEPVSKKNDAGKVMTPAGPKKNNDAAIAQVFEPAPKKPAGIKFGTIEERDLTAKRKEKTMPREQLTLAIDVEPENDVNTSINAPRTYRPMFRSAASNVNEKAEAFIRRRREALSKSMTNNEPRGYD